MKVLLWVMSALCWTTMALQRALIVAGKTAMVVLLVLAIPAILVWVVPFLLMQMIAEGFKEKEIA